MESYKTLWEVCRIEQEEKRSRFISTAARVSSRAEATAFIDKIKSEFPDARHHCYAYILADGYSKYSDDGEPSGTAGMPILNVIKASGILDVVIVVTRYFGGILLGTGGLTRAYSGGAASVLDAAQKAKQQAVVVYNTVCDYARYNSLVAKGFEQVEITVSSFAEQVGLQMAVPIDRVDSFEKEWTERFSGDALPQKEQEKLIICKID